MANAESILVPSSTMPNLGDIVAGKYRIESVIAEGGMGLVYEATHLQLEEKVAIKFLRTEMALPQSMELVERFVREARTSAKIKSEHVVRVHDVGSTESGTPFIVMEFLIGEDLEQVVDHHGVLQIPEAVDYVLQACEALAEAHVMGIVHRDLKPANLFLLHRADGSPCVKILDFGISKLTDVAASTPDMGMTKTHAVMGSPRYMSPEQMRSSKDVDARADIWAIGIILHELLAGAVPFDGASMPQICAAVLEQTPKNIRVLRPEITAELDAIVTKCLAKKPEERFENVAQLAHALSAFGTHEARASAERIARVLGGSGNHVVGGAAPGDFPIARSVAAPLEPGPALVERSAKDRLGASDSSGVPITWTGIEALNPVRRRRRAIFGMSAVLVALIGAGAGVFYEAHRHAVSGARLTLQPPATTQARAAAVAEVGPVKPDGSGVIIAIPPPPVNVASPDSQLPAVTSQTTTTSAKIATTKRASHPVSHEHATKPAATESAETEPGDIWGERK